MADKTFLDWPFFEDRHRALAVAIDDFAARKIAGIDHADTDTACKALVTALGEAGFLNHAAIDPATDPTHAASLDVRSLCLIRETLARHDGLADFALAGHRRDLPLRDGRTKG